MFQEYIEWLKNDKGIGNKSARDYASRLRRVCQLIKSESIDQESLIKLDTCEEFNTLSVSVKSQMRRAVRLYLAFQNK